MIRGATPHELAFGRVFNGELCEFGEPVFGYVIPSNKTAAKWKRMIFLGKAETQNSYVLFDGQAIVLSRSVRRISTTWRSHMAYYLHCKCFSWQFKAGFGPRVLPTMKKAIPKAVGFDMPLGPIEDDNKLHDKEAEAVIQFAEAEQKSQEEQRAMSAEDPMFLALQESKQPADDAAVTVFDDAVSGSAIPNVPMSVEAPAGSAPSTGQTGAPELDDPGEAVPVTPPQHFIQVDDESPRAAASARPSSFELNDEAERKRQRAEESKRQRINRLKAEYETRLSEVKLAYKEYFTVDDYTTDLDVTEDFNYDDDDIWAGEDSINLQSSIPLHVWSDHPIDQTPPVPEKWIDDLADQVEIERLCDMRVLVKASEFTEEPTGKLTTKFVRDWRLKMFGEGASQQKRWMRRSRLVAREFATSKRLDTFSPATGAHVSNILPFKYLLMKNELADMKCKAGYDVVLSSLDVSDAFLQVEQDNPVLVKLQGIDWVICRNLPGQRLGAKQWFQHLRAHLESTMGFEFSPEQPCMARTKDCTILIHVDDILFCGLESFWRDVFLPNMSQKFKVSHDELKGNGTSIKFLRRKITEVPDGLILTPGTSVEKVVKVFEAAFGMARQQKIPCSSDLQLIDNSPKLNEKDASAFRSVVGLCLYVGRDRPDLMFTIKELASFMSSPTVSSLQHLRKLVGFMKGVGDLAIKMQVPQAGIGKFQTGGEHAWVLESFSDADWSSNKSHRRSTSCGMHLLNCCFMYGSSRSQKVISLSSCESELHSLVSCSCDGIFVRACIEFALNCQIKHIVYTDNSAARQLACRQGTGRVRHLSGKVLWIQQKTQDGSIELRQVGTLDNISDIGTKCLSKQRLYLLMHESGLVYVPSFEAVGQEEFQRHNARVGTKTQMKKIARAIFNMSLAMGLEPSGTVVAAQSCSNVELTAKETVWTYKFVACVVFFMVVCMFLGWFAMRKVMRRISVMDEMCQRLEHEVNAAQEQLADHYSYAAELGTRLDEATERAEVRDDAVDNMTTRLGLVEEGLIEGTSMLEEAMNCLRYGLMELGGFVRFTSLSREQRSHMFTQERGNFVIWSLRTRAENTDPATIHVPERFRDDDAEDAEEEQGTDDEHVNEVSSGAERLLENMRLDQNVAIASERWPESSQIQQAILILLEATSGEEPEGLSMGVVTQIRNVFQRLMRWHRNRGLDEPQERFRQYVENMQSLMR